MNFFHSIDHVLTGDSESGVLVMWICLLLLLRFAAKLIRIGVECCSCQNNNYNCQETSQGSNGQKSEKTCHTTTDVLKSDGVQKGSIGDLGSPVPSPGIAEIEGEKIGKDVSPPEAWKTPRIPSVPRGKGRRRTGSLSRTFSQTNAGKSLKIQVCEWAKRTWKYPENGKLCTQMIHQFGIDVNEAVLVNGFTIFHCVCISGSFRLVHHVLPLADLRIMTENGDSPLFLATYAAASLQLKTGETPDLRILQLLLDAGVDINYPNRAGFTALHQAAKKGSYEIVDFLLENGADPNERSFSSVMPADLSFVYGHSKVTDLLSTHDLSIFA